MPNLATLPVTTPASDTSPVRPSLVFDIAAASIPLGDRDAALALIRSR